MYDNDVILSVTQVDSNISIPISSLRPNTGGITFTTSQRPTLLVELNYTLISRMISISVPTKNNATNVNQIELAFYGTDGQILRNSLNQPWIVETTPGVTTVCVILYILRKKKYHSFIYFSLNN